jgi:hypothetical protein
MVARSLAIAAVAAVTAATACSRGAGKTGTLAAGQAIPADWAGTTAAAASPAALVWVFRTEDCLTCQSADYALRRVQARFGERVPFLAVHVGTLGDSTIPKAFFRARRLRVDRLVTVSPRDFARQHGEAVVPSFLLLSAGTIVWSSARAGNPGVAGSIQLDTLVQHWIDARGRAPAPDAAGFP